MANMFQNRARNIDAIVNQAVKGKKPKKPKNKKPKKKKTSSTMTLRSHYG